ncbi:hypothetical protein L6164_019381 [Bauhinia variegata]|uniref:Uncharacterized protein n=1 Tax=Bauhinia variegata TaxID=167791 RepID=A0ACB9MTI8_BAUVA|nr:hypothetical protein L6164_019381 [Bauhinia variegata]
MANKMQLNLLMFALIGCNLMSSVISRKTYVVGDANGWRLPPHPSFYSEWAKNKIFRVGDTLVFPYQPGLNNVVQVSKEDFDICAMRTDLEQYYAGNSEITLDKPGDSYFFCSVGKHCESGQRLHITVS